MGRVDIHDHTAIPKERVLHHIADPKPGLLGVRQTLV
jgi:hypothetical protein